MNPERLYYKVPCTLYIVQTDCVNSGSSVFVSYSNTPTRGWKICLLSVNHC